MSKYECKVCKKTHQENSKIGKDHIEYKKENDLPIKIIARKIFDNMWDENATSMYDSANEVYCNTPIRIIREEWERRFKTGDMNLENIDENELEKMLNQFAKTITWELNSWITTKELFQRFFEVEDD